MNKSVRPCITLKARVLRLRSPMKDMKRWSTSCYNKPIISQCPWLCVTVFDWYTVFLMRDITDTLNNIVSIKLAS